MQGVYIISDAIIFQKRVNLSEKFAKTLLLINNLSVIFKIKGLPIIIFVINLFMHAVVVMLIIVLYALLLNAARCQ